MNYLKDFLNELTKDGTYYAEMTGNLAEIYISTEKNSIVMLEFDGDVYHINFRCDLLSQLVAQLTYDMTMIDSDIMVGVDFFSTPEAGIVYGEQALGLYFASIVYAIDNARLKEDEIDDSIYIVREPIHAYGPRNDKKDRMQRLWGTDLE